MGRGRIGAEATFKPEFINRLDDIVDFEPLSREQLREIVDLQVARLIARVAKRGVEVSLTDAARDLLGDIGYEPTFGARPLKRVISKRLVDPLALGLLEGEFAPGDRGGSTPATASCARASRRSGQRLSLTRLDRVLALPAASVTVRRTRRVTPCRG